MFITSKLFFPFLFFYKQNHSFHIRSIFFGASWANIMANPKFNSDFCRGHFAKQMLSVIVKQFLQSERLSIGFPSNFVFCRTLTDISLCRSSWSQSCSICLL